MFRFEKPLQMTVSVLAILGAIYGITAYIVHSETADIKTAVAKATSDIVSLKDDLRTNQQAVIKVDNKVDELLGKALERAYPVSGRAKPTREELRKAGNLISLAKALNIKLDQGVVTRYGSSIASLSHDPVLGAKAFSNLQQVANYRSFLNKDFVPMPSDLTPWPANDNYRPKFNIVLNDARPTTERSYGVLFAGGYVKPSDSARMEPLSEPHPEGSGIGLFVIEGGRDSISLDDLYAKNVIIRNAHIVYDGGPVKLKNVAFVNCTFTFKKSQPTIGLIEAILQSGKTNYIA